MATFEFYWALVTIKPVQGIRPQEHDVHCLGRMTTNIGHYTNVHCSRTQITRVTTRLRYQRVQPKYRTSTPTGGSCVAPVTYYLDGDRADSLFRNCCVRRGCGVYSSCRCASSSRLWHQRSCLRDPGSPFYAGHTTTSSHRAGRRRVTCPGIPLEARPTGHMDGRTWAQRGPVRIMHAIRVNWRDGKVAFTSLHGSGYRYWRSSRLCSW